MQSYVQLEKRAEDSLRAIERAFEVSVSLHDLRGTICHPGGKVALPGRHRHRHPACVLGRDARPPWDALCFKNCFSKSEMDAALAGKPFRKKCWKGVLELVVPLVNDGQHQLTLYAGAFREAGAKAPPETRAEKGYAALFNSLPALPSRRKLAELGSLLEFWGHGFLQALRSGACAPDASRGAAIRGFIAANAHRKTGLRDLAAHLHLSPSRTSHAVKEFTGMSFQDLLLKERMARASILLESSGDSLAEIAAKLGFENEFYFNRAFKKARGTPPGSFRRLRLAGRV